jgi:hypothetical protein
MDWQHGMGDDESTSVVDSLQECSTSYGGGFAAGFTGFLASGEFSDICVVFHGQEHHLHSLILGYHSEFFRRAFSSGMRESTQRRLELSVEDPLHLLPLVVAYFYEGQIILTDKTCFGMLAIARQLMVAKLEVYCRYTLLEASTPHAATPACIASTLQVMFCSDSLLYYIQGFH